MRIRPLQPSDLEQLDEIDATIESARYFHVNLAGENLDRSWAVNERPLREKLILANRMDDEARFAARQLTSGAEEGLATGIEIAGRLAGALLAQPSPADRTLRLVDLRVDYDVRRQGLGTALIYQALQHARQREMRAVRCETLSNNEPAGKLLARCGFELAGIDTLRHTNHDLVKEAVTLVWYATLEE